MQKDQIRQLALENGFKLKTQSDGGLDLNPYVYDFARALIQTAHRWIPVEERLPEVNADGESTLVQFCVYGKSTNRMAVFDAVYLHEKEMQDTRTGECQKYTGWHTYSYREDADYQEIYDPIVIGDDDYIVGWQPFAAAPVISKEQSHD